MFTWLPLSNAWEILINQMVPDISNHALTVREGTELYHTSVKLDWQQFVFRLISLRWFNFYKNKCSTTTQVLHFNQLLKQRFVNQNWLLFFLIKIIVVTEKSWWSFNNQQNQWILLLLLLGCFFFGGGCFFCFSYIKCFQQNSPRRGKVNQTVVPRRLKGSNKILCKITKNGATNLPSLTLRWFQLVSPESNKIWLSVNVWCICILCDLFICAFWLCQFFQRPHH